jgi:hypothetical protein
MLKPFTRKVFSIFGIRNPRRYTNEKNNYRLYYCNSYRFL